METLGLSVKSLDEATRTEFGFGKEVEGLVIDDVDLSSEAARKGLAEGDVIVEINQQPVSDPEDAKEIITRAKDNGRGSVLLLVDRAGDVSFVALKLNDEGQ